jgi:regulator of protease activity HflC (stomatin/prohibitin superfamily)
MKQDDRKMSFLNPVSVTLLIILLAVCAGLYYFKVLDILMVVPIVIISVLIASSIHIADQWEKAVVLRMGKFTGLKGPGFFLIIPIIDQITCFIDQRVRVAYFKAEETLTRVERAALEVQDYTSAIAYIAQTGLRDIIGKHELSDLLQDREKIANDLQTVLDEHTNPWGITCQSVGIRDIVIPKSLADAMSKQAQAERERKARVILGTAETEISEKFAQASREYINNPIALQLRAMNMLYEGLKEKGSMIIVPSSALDSMNLGVIGGLASLARGNESSEANNKIN